MSDKTGAELRDTLFGLPNNEKKIDAMAKEIANTLCGSTSQAPASTQYADWKKYPNTYAEPTHEQWLLEVHAHQALRKEWEILSVTAIAAGNPSVREYIGQLERELAATEAAHTTELARLDAELAAAKAQIEGEKHNINALHTELHKVQSENAELRAEVERTKGDIQQAARLNMELMAEVERLRKEIEILRLYGNKDCTGMADDALAAMMELTEIFALAREHGAESIAQETIMCMGQLKESDVKDTCFTDEQLQAFVSAVEQRVGWRMRRRSAIRTTDCTGAG